MKRLIIFLMVLVLVSFTAVGAWGATNNFTANGGEWNTAGNWSLGHVPDDTEDCTFTGITTGTTPLTITTTQVYAKSIDFSTAGAAFTLSGSPTINLKGSLTCKTGMTWSHNGYIIITTNPAILTSNSVSFHDNVIVVRSSLTLADNLNTGTYGSVCLQFSSASLNTDGHNVTAYQIFDWGVASTPTINLGSGSSVVSLVEMTWDSTSTVSTAGTGTIQLTGGNTNYTYKFYGNYSGTNNGIAVNIKPYNARTITIAGTNTFGTLNLQKPTTGTATIKFPASTTTTLNSLVSAAGNGLTITSSDGANAATLSDSSGINRIYNCTLSYITGTGGASWRAFTIDGNVNGGNNTGIAFNCSFFTNYLKNKILDHVLKVSP